MDQTTTNGNGEGKTESAAGVETGTAEPKAELQTEPVSESGRERIASAVSGKSQALSLEELIYAEIENNQKSVQRMQTWGIMAVIFLMSYLAWLFHSIQDNFFNPEVIAAFVSGTIEDNLPEILSNTQREAELNAPFHVESLSEQLQAMVPEVRQMAEQQIDQVYLQMPLMRESINQGLRDYFAENRDDFRTFAAAHDDRAFVKFFVGRVLSELGRELGAQFGETKEFHLGKIREQSLGQLTYLNERLKELAEKSPYNMSRKELVGRRLIAVWASLLHESATGQDSLDQ